ncbi:MAG TPA: class I SAM-dependent methyltransferase, partial [Candidatus Acidoferrum sp.]
MATPSTANRPTPERIFALMNAFQNTQALKTGIELDIFTAIAEGTNSAPLLAAKVNASERGVRILCDYLTIIGLLTKENGKYSLTDESALFLDRRSPASLVAVTGFLASPWHKKNTEALTEAVRKGGTAGPQGDNSKPQDEVWVAFARSMAKLTIPPANFIAELLGCSDGKPCSVLDIAAGHGNYGITVAQKNPNAKVVAVDWPSVLEVAQENARAAGVSDRYTVRPGSAFETDLGGGYDFVLLTNIFHHFDMPTCEKLMR